MANLAISRGLQPYGGVQGMGYYVAGAEVFPGDLVKYNSSGLVVAAAASDASCGVAASYASASGVELMVFDRPEQKFTIIASGSVPAAQTDINLNYNFIAGTGSSTYKLSRFTLDSATGGATTATLPLKLLGIERRPNNALGANAECVVLINNHQFAGGTGTAGT